MAQSENKVAIVTGSATGVGAAAARQLAERGCNVVINYTKSKDEAEQTAATCRTSGVEALAFQADVSSDEACRAMADAAVTAWGRIDYLINNPGGDSWPCHCGAARCRGKTGVSFFTLPHEIQREYLPLLAPWFRRKHADKLQHLS